MQLRIIAAGLAGAALVASPVAAWGPEGHTIIARVAAQRLTGQAKTDWDWLVRVGIPALNKATNGCQIDPQDPLGPVNSRDNAKSNIANWPDCFRGLDRTTANWHFEDLPLDQALATLPTPDPWCAKGCASQALAANLKILAARPTNPADTARAWVYVIHFIGDIHQPLHTSDNGDQGGNKVTIDTAGSGVSATEFHGMWDTPLVQKAYGSDLDGATAALTKATSAPPVAWTKGARDVAGINTDIRSWIADSHKLGIDAYKGLKPPPSAPGPYSATVDKAYVTAETPVAAGQLQRAAVRLTAVLTATLTWTPPAG